MELYKTMYENITMTNNKPQSSLYMDLVNTARTYVNRGNWCIYLIDLLKMTFDISIS